MAFNSCHAGQMLFINILHGTVFYYNSVDLFHGSVHAWECAVLVISVVIACLGEISRIGG